MLRKLGKSPIDRGDGAGEPQGLTVADGYGGGGSARLFAHRTTAGNGREPKTMSDVAERVKKIVVEHLGVESEKVTENASFIDDLGADSLDTVELVMAFEEEFGCEIPDDAAEHILTVGDAVRFLEKNATAA